jgi:tRNA U34 5-methylaminomethyl-2-thiouridine-forming methyltransferase MnmC
MNFLYMGLTHKINFENDPIWRTFGDSAHCKDHESTTTRRTQLDKKCLLSSVETTSVRSLYTKYDIV